jgi:hypothetical protein
MQPTTLEDILGDFNSATPDDGTRAKNCTTLTIWVPLELKARYRLLQEKSGRRFGKKAREAIVALITAAEAREAS